jgi:predicted Zn finger-like uncharacterized protein
MRFTCEGCNAQYMISDEKVGAKGVRVRCKKCGSIITVRPRSESEPTEPERDNTQVSGAPDEPGPDKTTVDPPEEGGEGFNVGDEEIGDALDNFLGGEGGEGEFEDEDLEDEERPDFDRQSTRVFSVEEMQKVQEEREQAEQEAEERQQISELYQSAQAAEGGEAPAGEEHPAEAASPSAGEPSGEDRERVEWYAAVDERQVGPMSITEIASRWEQGEFDAETLAWKTGFDDWIPIFEVKELRFLLAEREPPPAEEQPADREETEDEEREESADWKDDTWEEEEEREEAEAPDSGEGYYDEDDALSSASSAAFAGADVDWKPSAVAELNALAEEELASLKPPPDPEPEEERLPFGEDLGMAAEGEEVGEGVESGEMEDGDSSIIGQIAAEEEAAAKRAEKERLEEERRSEEARQKKEEEELAAQEAARREREEEKRERAAPSPEQVIPARGSIPRWALGVMGGSGLVIVVLLGFIAYKLASGSGEEKPAEAITPPTAEGVQPQPMAPPAKGPSAVTPAPTPPSPETTEAGKTAAVMESPASKAEAEEEAREEKKAGFPPKRKPPLGKKKTKKRIKEVAVAPKETPPSPPPAEEKPPPRTRKSKGSLLDFEDESEFDRVTGSSPGETAKKPPPSKPVVKELPPLSNADVLGIMRQHIAEFKACNRKQKEIDPSVKGKMVVSFIVNPSGKVGKVDVTTPDFNKTFVASCISKVIHQLNFPPFGGKPKKVPFPFTVK